MRNAIKYLLMAVVIVYIYDNYLYAVEISVSGSIPNYGGIVYDAKSLSDSDYLTAWRGIGGQIFVVDKTPRSLTIE